MDLPNVSPVLMVFQPLSLPNISKHVDYQVFSDPESSLQAPPPPSTMKEGGTHGKLKLTDACGVVVWLRIPEETNSWLKLGAPQLRLLVYKPHEL